MKKQTLFATGTTLRADGTNPITLTPADLPVLALLPQLSYKDSGDCTYNSRDAYRCRYRCPDLSIADRKKIGILCTRLMPEIVGYDTNYLGYFCLYNDTTYQFLARDTVGLLQQLHPMVAGLPPAVDGDEYQAANGLTVSVGPKNYTPRIEYRVPFDRAAWQQRHQTTAQVNTTDAQAEAEQANAALQKAQATQAQQKAKLLKTARIAAVAALVLLVAILTTVILKKK